MKTFMTLVVLMLFLSTANANDISPQVKAPLQTLFTAESELQLTAMGTQLLEVVVGANVYFASADGRFLYLDRVIDVEKRQDLTELKLRTIRKAQIAALPDEMQLSFPAKGKSKQSITVFTDIDCPYCRQLHDRIPSLNALGITVNYVMLPRAGEDSNSFRKAVAAVCDGKPQAAMTRAMAGKRIEPKNCENTIAEQLAFANRLGIASTPSTVLPSGELRVGLYSPEAMAKLLQL